MVRTHLDYTTAVWYKNIITIEEQRKYYQV